MLQILDASSAGDCQFLNPLTITTDPDDTSAFRANFKARFALADRNDAEAWEAVFPGIGDRYDIAIEESNNKRFNDTTKDDNLEVMMTFAKMKGVEQDGEALAGGATVKNAKCALSKKIQVVDCNLVFGGISQAQVGEFARMLRGKIHVETQLGMFTDEGEKAAAK